LSQKLISSFVFTVFMLTAWGRIFPLWIKLTSRLPNTKTNPRSRSIVVNSYMHNDSDNKAGAVPLRLATNGLTMQRNISGSKRKLHICSSRKLGLCLSFCVLLWMKCILRPFVHTHFCTRSSAFNRNRRCTSQHVTASVLEKKA